MSLLVHRRDIARAVVGDLSPAAEDRLRAHLGRCAPCRAFYDQLSHVAAAVTASGSDPSQRDRLARALPDAGEPSLPAARPPARHRRWLLTGLALAPAAALVLWLARPPSPGPAPTEPRPEIALRGASTADAAAGGPTLVLYASRRTANGRAPLRLVGEFPGSGTVRVAGSDYLQFGVRGLPSAAAVSIVADGAGVAHVFLPRAGAPPPLAPAGPGPATVGPSFDLARAPGPGRYTLRARFAPTLDAAMDGALGQVSGLLIIEP